MLRTGDHRMSQEDLGSVEKSIRSFIIKSIHLIVQARNGNVYGTNCVSDVGARNNMMIYLEEDPEIGATIKQTLESGFPVNAGDSFVLDILANWPKDRHVLMVMESWQFRLDSSTAIPTNQSVGIPTNQSASSETTTGVAMADLRKSRLFEKLGTLLKSLMVTTRLLPAYQYSRHQEPDNYQMCYMVERGQPDLTRLGPDASQRLIGCLPTHVGGCSLHVTVHYRTRMTYTTKAEMVYAGPPLDQPLFGLAGGIAGLTHQRLEIEEEHYATNRRLSRQTSKEIDLDKVARIGNTGFRSAMDSPSAPGPDANNSLLNKRFRPAFGTGPLADAVSLPAELDEDNLSDLLATDTSARGVPRANSPPPPPRTMRAAEEDREEGILDVGVVEGALDELSEPFATHPDVDLTLIKLPFNTNPAGAELIRMFANIKEREDLDLFYHLSPSGRRRGRSASSTDVGAAAVVEDDWELLSEELERHEKTLKDFDDFLGDFDRFGEQFVGVYHQFGRAVQSEG